MITVTGAKGLRIIPRSHRKPLQARSSASSPPVRTASPRLALVRPNSATALIVAVKGSADYYTLQWAERAPTSAKAPIGEARWLARLRLLQPIRVCPIVAGERLPYPSCASPK